MKYLIVKTDYNEDKLTSGLYEVYEDLTFEEVQKYLKNILILKILQSMNKVKSLIELVPLVRNSLI